MVIPGEAPRQVEIMTPVPAPALLSSSPPPSSSSSVMLRGNKTHHRIPLPVLKGWGNQRLLRCGGGGNGTVAASEGNSGRRSAATDDGFEQIRAKLMVHLREAADRIGLPAVVSGDGDRKLAIAAAATVKEKEEKYEEEEEEDEEEKKSLAATAAADPVSVPAVPLALEDLPWNLRTRRGASTGRNPNTIPPPPSLPSSTPPTAKSLRSRSGVSERRRRPRFSVSLSKEEIDEDLYAVTGRRASRRPKKRPRAVQKQLDLIFPGSWLSEVTPELYQVVELPPPPPS